jgi:hypothetical protein
MSQLFETMEKLSEALPPAGDVRVFQDLEDVVYVLYDELGYGVHLLSMDDGSAAELPAGRRRLFDAIVYLQGAWVLLSDIAYDGVYSVFYNCTGEEIELRRTALKRGDEALATLFEEAYALVAAPLAIAPGSNFITRCPDESPYERVDRETLARLEAIENRIEAMRMDTFDRVIALYRAVR